MPWTEATTAELLAMTEDQWRRHVTGYAQLVGWLVNFTYRARTTKGAWRTTATAKGYPDLTLLHPAGWALWLELKTEDGDPSAEQVAWIRAGQAVPSDRVGAYVARPSQWPGIRRLLDAPHNPGTLHPGTTPTPQEDTP